MSGTSRNGGRGLREVATLQTLSCGARRCERPQLVNKFARLENERARLERELGMWESRKSTTEDKLAEINKRIVALRPLLLEDPAELSADRKACSRKGNPTSAEAVDSTVSRTHAVALEY